MMFSGIIILVLIIGVIAYLAGWRPDFLKSQHHTGMSSHADSPPLEILQERYARGEITKAEYESMKRDLE